MRKMVTKDGCRWRRKMATGKSTKGWRDGCIWRQTMATGIFQKKAAELQTAAENGCKDNGEFRKLIAARMHKRWLRKMEARKKLKKMAAENS